MFAPRPLPILLSLLLSLPLTMLAAAPANSQSDSVSPGLDKHLTAPSHGLSDSVSVGLDAVEAFYTETAALVHGAADAAAAEEFLGASLDRTNEVAEEIRSLGWLESPGRRRYNRVYDAFSEYAEGEIESIRRLGAGLAPYRRGRVAEAAKKLTRLKEERLLSITRTLELETYRKKQPKPVPIMEPTPHKRNRDEGEGIYFR